MRYKWLVLLWAAFWGSEICGQGAAVGECDCTDVNWNELKGDFEPVHHPAFQLVPSTWTTKTGIYLRSEALQAFESMATAASEDGVHLSIISATRNWHYQRQIWNRKWNSPRFMGFEPLQRAEKILEFSSMPGASRHHWGTDVDLNALENEYFESGKGAKEYAWLQLHARRFGFVQVYGDQSNGRTGYLEERWHWSYWPLSQRFLCCYLALAPEGAFTGFEGAAWADSLHIISRYVAGIDSLP